MTEFMRRKCFFRYMKLCDVLIESGLCRGSPTGGIKIFIAKGHMQVVYGCRRAEYILFKAEIKHSFVTDLCSWTCEL